MDFKRGSFRAKGDILEIFPSHYEDRSWKISMFGDKIEIITEMDLPGNQTGLPFTYEHEGKQYIAMFVGGGGIPAELVAYALP